MKRSSIITGMVRELMMKLVKYVSMAVGCSDDFIAVVSIVWSVVIQSFSIEKMTKGGISSWTSIFLWSSPVFQSFSLCIPLTFSFSVSLCHSLSISLSSDKSNMPRSLRFFCRFCPVSQIVLGPLILTSEPSINPDFELNPRFDCFSKQPTNLNPIFRGFLFWVA